MLGGWSGIGRLLRAGEACLTLANGFIGIWEDCNDE